MSKAYRSWPVTVVTNTRSSAEQAQRLTSLLYRYQKEQEKRETLLGVGFPFFLPLKFELSKSGQKTIVTDLIVTDVTVLLLD